MKRTSSSSASPQLTLRRQIVRTLSTTDLRAVIGASYVAPGCGDPREDLKSRKIGLCTTVEP